MKLTIFGIQNEIIFDKDKINILEIQNKKFFVDFLEMLNTKCNGEEKEDNQILLKENNIILDFEKEMLLILDVFNIDYNSKKILTKVYRIIEDKIKISQEYKLEELTIKLRNYLITEINELPFEFNIKSDLEVQELLKCFSLKIDTTCYNSPLERLEFMVDVVSTLNISKILVAVNLKSFLSKEELVEFYKYTLYNNVNLLVIENSSSEEILDYEKKLIIDQEFDEFIL